MNRGALEGIRVLDLGRFLAAPWAGVLMAELGAEVIRLERPGGESDRKLGLTALDGQGMSFHVANLNKKAITLDIRQPRGWDILRRLVGYSDIVLENFSPGGAELAGISYETMQEMRSDIIYVSVSGFGNSGPYAQRLAFDPIVKAMSGTMSITGFPGSPPARDGSPWVDFVTPTNAVVGALAALYHREKTGEGQMIEAAMIDSALVIACRVFVDYMVRGVVREQMGNQSPYASQNAYQTRDGWMFLATIQAIWKRFCRLIERDDLVTDPRFETDALRFENRAELDQIIQAWMGDKTSEEVSRLLEKARVPHGPVNDGPKVAADPHFRAREMIVELDYPGGEFPGKKLAVPGVPIKLSKTPGKVKSPAPKVGQDNEAIYCGLLGLSRAELDELRAEGIV